MYAPSSADYRFGPFRLDPAQHLLFRDGGQVPLPPKAIDLLLVLVEHGGRVVPKQDLLDRVWPNTFVEESNLSVTISLLRKALGPDVIDTIPKRGYRLVAPLEREALPPGDSAPAVSGFPSARAEASSLRIEARRSQRSWRTYVATTVLLLAGVVVTFPMLVAHKPFTVAVLPFRTERQTPLAGYLTEGLAESITSDFSNASSAALHVKAQSTVAPYAGRGATAAQIGRALGADAVLAGRVAEQDGRWTVHVELVAVKDESLMWGRTYTNRTFMSMDAVRREIAVDAANHLPVALSAEQRAQLTLPPTRSVEAQRLMDRANLLFYLATPDSLARCLAQSEQAIRLDPGFVSPYGEIASVYSLMSVTDVMPPREAHERVVEWQRKAMQVNPAAPISRIASLGEQATFDWDWKGIADTGPVHPFYRDVLLARGRVEEAVAFDRRAAHDDPRSVLNDYFLAESLYYARQFDEAIASYQRSIELDPAFLWARFGLGRTYLQKGLFEEATRELRAALALKPAAGLLGYAYGRQGERARALDVLTELAERSRHEYVSPLAVAWVHIGLGHTNDAFEGMRQACAMRVPALARIGVEPIYDPLRGDRRFREIEGCVGIR